MPKFLRATALSLALVSTLALAACKSDKEKADDYFASGQALLAEGDEDRAMVEFRNVFKYDPFHLEARETYAGILVKRGELEEAYSQYLRLIEQYPDTAEVRQTLAEMAIHNGDFEEAERHGREALRLAPDKPEVKAIGLFLDYRQASLDKDDAGRARIADQARALLDSLPNSQIARRIVIDQIAGGPDPIQALPLVEQALVQEPNSLEYHMMKFLLLNQTGQVEATGKQLQVMFALFPDNKEVRSSLIRWYMVQKDYDGAEAFLRETAGDPTSPFEQHLGLLQFLQTMRGPDAARAELQSLVAANGDSDNARIYAAMLASLDFDAGKKEEAIAAMREIVAASKSSEQGNRVKGMLARSLDSTGDRDGAATLVTEILETDHTNAVALKLRAGWELQAGKTAAAIQDLNDALTNAPNDPEIFNLLAAAQNLEGNPESMGEYMGKAVQASGRAAPESLRYASFLASQGNAREAEQVLMGAWSVAPANQDVLRALVELYMGQEKWPQVQTAIDFLAKTDAKGIDLLRAALLEAQGKPDEAVTLLQAGIDRGEEVPTAAQAALQILLRKGDTAAAQAFLERIVSRFPEDRDLKLLSAGTQVTAGNVDAAIADYRALIASKPDDEPPVRLLYGVLSRHGKAAEATEVLDAGLAAMPGASSLLWLKAGELERDGKIDEAITIYEELHARDGSDILVANNLASLLATYRSDAESLAKAELISRRLRGQDNPAFQDTYGWIAFLTGNTYGAIAHLEPAAKGLPEDALTQYHLGKLYQSMDRPEEAVAQFDKALALAAKQPAVAALPQMQDAAAMRDKLKAEIAAKQ